MGVWGKNLNLVVYVFQRAMELSEVGKNIAETKNYKNFEIIFADFDIRGSE